MRNQLRLLPAGAAPNGDRLKALLVDESADGAAEALRAGLGHAGYEVGATLDSPRGMLHLAERLAPDIIVIRTASPSREVLEHVAALSQRMPRPVLVFATDAEPQSIRKAMRAGVSAYFLDGLDRARAKGIIAAAIATFEELQRLRRQLAERKSVDRAKALLMKNYRLDEEAAYAMLRRIAMERNQRIGEVAQRVIDGA